MDEVRREGDEVVVRMSLDELRLMLGTLNEAYNGAFAIPIEQWETLVGQPPERAESLMDQISALLQR